jgi:hypothetical protein
VQKPEILTTFNRSYYNQHKKLISRHIFPGRDGHFAPAKTGQDLRIFHLANIKNVSVMLQYPKTKAPESAIDKGVSCHLLVDKTIEISKLDLIKDMVKIIKPEEVLSSKIIVLINH